jgi:HK97 family phage major capsid protein
MDKKKLLALLAKKEARKAELKAKITATEDVKELRSLQTEWNELNDEMTELRSMIDSLPDEEDEGNKGKKKNSKENRSADNDDAVDAEDDDGEEFRSDKLNGKNEQRGATPKGQLNPVGTYTAGDAQGEARAKELKEAAEKRGKDLKEMRAVTVASTGVIMPAHQATTINPTFNEVSSLIDNVASRTLIGGESFTQPYIAGYGEGDYKTDGQDYADAEPARKK